MGENLMFFHLMGLFTFLTAFQYFFYNENMRILLIYSTYLIYVLCNILIKFLVFTNFLWSSLPDSRSTFSPADNFWRSFCV